MGRFRVSQVWLALVVMPLLTAGQAMGQSKPTKDDPTDEKQPRLLSCKALKPKDGDDELRKLQIARHNEAVEEVKAVFAFVQTGRYAPTALSDVGKRICESGLEVYDDPKDRIRLLTDYVELMKRVEKAFEAQHQDGRISDDFFHQARYQRIDAEIQLLKAKRAAEKPKEK